jgi:uncharacterized protein
MVSWLAVLYTAIAVNSTASPRFLEALLGSRLRARLLGWLLSHPDERFFVRQLASLLEEDSTNLSRELARLAELGVVTSSQEGKQKYYRANPRCPVFPELRGLVLKTSGLGDVLRESLQPFAERIETAFVFGSFASGRADADSDLDLMVVGAVTLRELVEALGQAQDRLGREVNPVVYPVAEMRDKLSQGHRFLSSVLEGPKLFVIGTQDELDRLARLRMAD